MTRDMRIKNFFKWLHHKDKERLALKETARVFGNMEVLQRKGLLHWDARHRRLFICEPLALVMLDTEERWTGFLRNVFLWQTYVCQQEAWESYFTKEEAKAIMEAKKKYTVITKAETDRLRRTTRERIRNDGQIKQPKTEPYEIFIIGDATPVLRTNDDHKKAEQEGHILAVGQYDPDTENIQMVTWSEVSSQLKQ